VTLTPQMIGIGVSLVVFLAIIAFRARRMTQSTPFNPNLAIIYPVVLALFGAAFALSVHPQGLEWAWLVGALVIGGGLGWLRASTVRMSVDPVTGKLMAQASAAAIIFLVGLIGVRFVLRAVLTTEAGALGLRLVMADVIFVAMGVGLFATRSVEMILRGRKLLAIHAANPAVLTSEAAGV